MNMFEHFKYGPQVIVKLVKDGLQAIFKLNKLRSALIEHFSTLKNPKLYKETGAIRAPVNKNRLHDSDLIHRTQPFRDMEKQERSVLGRPSHM